MLEAMSSEEILGTALDDLLDAPGELLNYKHTLAYTGSMPLEELVETLRRSYEVSNDLQTHLSTGFETANRHSEVLVVDQQTAQAQVRIEFADGVYDSEDGLLANLYTSYFGSGMSSVVFQELREARALAYSASARYSAGSRINAENLMMGSIGTQTDKTVDDSPPLST